MVQVSFNTRDFAFEFKSRNSSKFKLMREIFTAHHTHIYELVYADDIRFNKKRVNEGLKFFMLIST